LNCRNQVGHAGERVATDALASDLSKAALDQVQPDANGRHEVQHEKWMLLRPDLDLGLGVGAIVFDDQVVCNISVGLRGPV